MAYNPTKPFVNRHVGIRDRDLEKMLQTIGVNSLSELIDQTVPEGIRLKNELDLPDAQTESEYIRELELLSKKNKVFRSYIGQGYYGTVLPNVILRNVFENPGWYTQYTPYQAEIAQGRLEALLNFQTLVSDLTGLPIANASLLDEGTAAAEAMAMLFAQKNRKSKDKKAIQFFVDNNVFEQTKDILITRAAPIGIELVFGDWKEFNLSGEECAGALIQYPDSNGSIHDYRAFANKLKEQGIYLVVAADLLSLALFTPPGEWGADVVVGTTQRFGVPMGYGGPHAGYFATLPEFKRVIPGRIIGVSKDVHGNSALRMALQTREQHIKRERATSNICTAQALLAIIASMYAVYHGPEGIRAIALEIHTDALIIRKNLLNVGFTLDENPTFDTVSVEVESFKLEAIKAQALEKEINFFYQENRINISVDETITKTDIEDILTCFGVEYPNLEYPEIDKTQFRTSPYLEHEVFNSYRSESAMMRYIKRLENKDLSLVHSMIALGSCTMKLNAASELLPVTWPEFGNIHPFVPKDQAEGYHIMFERLAEYLNVITGFTACSFQPNSGAQGEYTGLMTIRAYHLANNNENRNVTIIPSSAHGTNPASAVMAGMKVVVVACDENGNIDIDDLKAKAELHKENLSALMVTYPSTHGVFEESIKEICEIIHDNGGLVYMDGANMNAQVGLTSPAEIGADVCHLNLHKTFSIPHGGGGPGMGPICVNDKLKQFLPGHAVCDIGGQKSINAVSSAPWGSASILLISYGYVRMLGREGVKKSTEIAILNANYMKAKLIKEYPVLYLGKNGHCAHEMIIDLRKFKAIGISAEDVAKRLIDYGFHSPTLSFPVAGTIMIEPTESEDIDELDRFCDAMLEIKKEIDAVAKGEADVKNNVLVNAPHTLAVITSDDWDYPYTRKEAAFPLDYLNTRMKFWPSVARVDNAFGDRNLICTCPPIESYQEIES